MLFAKGDTWRVKSLLKLNLGLRVLGGVILNWIMRHELYSVIKSKVVASIKDSFYQVLLTLWWRSMEQRSQQGTVRETLTFSETLTIPSHFPSPYIWRNNETSVFFLISSKFEILFASEKRKMVLAGGVKILQWLVGTVKQIKKTLDTYRPRPCISSGKPISSVSSNEDLRMFQRSQSGQRPSILASFTSLTVMPKRVSSYSRRTWASPQALIPRMF